MGLRSDWVLAGSGSVEEPVDLVLERTVDMKAGCTEAIEWEEVQAGMERRMQLLTWIS